MYEDNDHISSDSVGVIVEVFYPHDPFHGAGTAWVLWSGAGWNDYSSAWLKELQVINAAR